ncbi:hypothetical protein D3C72_2064100 [compost metagenome]
MWRKKNSVRAMAASMRPSSSPPSRPQTRAAYCSSLARLACLRTRSMLGRMMAKVCAWSSSYKAVNSWPMACVDQSCGTPTPIRPFKARVALHMMLARTS